MADGPIIEDEEERRRLRAEARRVKREAVEKKVRATWCNLRHLLQ